MKTREEIIEELNLEVNPGSMKMKDLIEKHADALLEIEGLKLKVKDMQEKVEDTEKSKTYWYQEYSSGCEKINELKESLVTVQRVMNEIVERWK